MQISFSLCSLFSLPLPYLSFPSLSLFLCLPSPTPTETHLDVVYLRSTNLAQYVKINAIYLINTGKEKNTNVI